MNAAISQAMAALPAGIHPPSMYKHNQAAAPILFMALTSADLPLQTVDEFAETDIAQRLSMVDGVSEVQVWGSAKYAVRVDLDPTKLAARHIGASEVAQAIRNNNVMLPTGVLYGKNRTLTINATGQLTDADQFRRLIIAYRNGGAVRLGDVATVLDDIQNNKGASWYDDERAIGLAVMRQPGVNTVEVADAVKAELARDREGAAEDGQGASSSSTGRCRSSTRCTTSSSR